MGMTIAEKIIAAAAGVDSVKPGDIHTVTLDRMMSNDGTTHLTVDMYNNKLKHPRIADPKKLVFIVDHNVPSDSPKTAASQKKMRDFAKENGIDFWEGKGVCHQVMMENYVRPGELIFGADSHTCSYGALGAFGTGVGCTDFLYGMVTGQSWVLVPESVKFNLIGELPEGVYARDLILTIIGQVGANGCNYQVMEFTGEGAKTLSISDRIALCNMAVEAGAKTGIFEADEKAMEYLKEHGREPKAVFHSDPDAHYIREYTIDLSKVEPVVAKPDFVDNLSPAKEVRGIKIDEAFLGSCNNGRIEDLRVGAEVIKGKKVADKVRFLVVPFERDNADPADVPVRSARANCRSSSAGRESVPRAHPPASGRRRGPPPPAAIHTDRLPPAAAPTLSPPRGSAPPAPARTVGSPGDSPRSSPRSAPSSTTPAPGTDSSERRRRRRRNAARAPACRSRVRRRARRASPAAAANRARRAPR